MGATLDTVIDKYFSILKDYFGEAFKIASRNKFRKEKYRPVLRRIYDGNLIVSTFGTLFDDLKNLDWRSQETAIRNSRGIKATYVGSEYGYQKPAWSTSEFLRKSCLYVDTIILEDQVLNQLVSLRGSDRFVSRIDFHYVVDFVIEYLTLEHLFKADSGTPLCTLAPASLWVLEQNNLSDATWNLSSQTTAAYASELLGRTFSSIEDLQKFLSKIKNDSEFLSLIQSTQKLVAQNDRKISLEYIQEIHNLNKQIYGNALSSGEVYEAILRMPSHRIYDLLYNGRLMSIPVTDYKATWNSLIWLMKHDNANVFSNLKKRVFSKDALVISALQQEDLRWLGNVPMNKIGELRERGELADLRDLIGKNIINVENASDEEFVEVGNQVKYNIEQAIRKHNTQVGILNERYRTKYEIDASLVVSGAMGIFATCYLSIPYAAGIITSITGGCGLKTLNDYLEQREKVKELKTKPVAMLFDAKRVVGD
jgi:hypothetical protein